MRRLLLLAAATTVAALGGAGPAAAASTATTVPFTFAGATCEAVASATYTLPARARLASAAAPLVGAIVGGTKGEGFEREELARVVGVDVRGRAVTVTVAADPDLCRGSALPGEPDDGPWVAALDAHVTYTVTDLAWARRFARSVARDRLPGYEVGARCRTRATARFTCSVSGFVGDNEFVGSGTVSLGREQEWPSYRFRVRIVDTYCRYVTKRSLRRCSKVQRWTY